jgi:hypothetical protein
VVETRRHVADVSNGGSPRCPAAFGGIDEEAKAMTAHIFTVDDAKAYVSENLDGITKAFNECKDVPDWARGSDRIFELWKAGCWLTAMLRKAGADEKEVFDIGFVHGQRSAFGDAWRWAVVYANQYAANKSIQDKPGIELADKINEEFFGRKA